MLKTLSVALLPLLLFFGGGGLDYFVSGSVAAGAGDDSGTQEKMIVSNGTVTVNLDLAAVGGSANGKGSRSQTITFGTDRDSFFTVMVFKNELRGAMPSSMDIHPQTFPSIGVRRFRTLLSFATNGVRIMNFRSSIQRPAMFSSISKDNGLNIPPRTVR